MVVFLSECAVFNHRFISLQRATACARMVRFNVGDIRHMERFDIGNGFINNGGTFFIQTPETLVGKEFRVHQFRALRLRRVFGKILALQHMGHCGKAGSYHMFIRSSNIASAPKHKRLDIYTTILNYVVYYLFYGKAVGRAEV
jgi:hypothetical protein